MIRTQKTTRPPRNVYERLSRRLDELAERDGHHDNADKIAAMRKAAFASVDELQKSGRVKIPK